MDSAKLRKMLDKIDRFMAEEPEGPALYQILSGSVRGPDNGAGKHQVTMPLRAVVWPRTAKQGSTGMMTGGKIVNQIGAVANILSHYHGHVNQAIGYLKQAGMLDAEGNPVAAKQEDK